MLGETPQHGFKGPIPSHSQLHDFLPPSDHAALLAWVSSTEADFRPAKVNRGDFKVDPDMRVADVSWNLGPLEPILEQRLLAALPQIRAEAGIGGPMPDRVELQLAAHGDGAYYKAHLDVLRGRDGKLLGKEAGEVRLLSAVYYFHNEPKQFSGGELRLYRVGCSGSDASEDPANHVDFEPIQNSLLVFPSWALHEVRPVRVPSGAFRDYRFALNCWFCASLGG